MNIELKDRLLGARRSRGLSQSELAELVGVDKCKISLWESGRISPSLPSFIKLVKALRTNADFLLGIIPDDYIDVSDLEYTQVEGLYILAHQFKKVNKNLREATKKPRKRQL